MPQKFQPLILLAIGGLITSLLSFFIWAWVNGSDNPLLFGRIASIETSSITVVGRGRETTVNIGIDTRIIRRSEILSMDDLAVGQYVQVVGRAENPPALEAESIILLRPPKAPSPPLPNAPE